MIFKILLLILEEDARTEDRLGPVSDTFHEWVGYHQRQRRGAQEDAAIRARYSIACVCELSPSSFFPSGEVHTHLYQLSCVSTASPAVNCGARKAIA
jgi:hypothetical protein